MLLNQQHPFRRWTRNEFWFFEILFIGPVSDHCLPLSLTQWLTQSPLLFRFYWCDSGVWGCHQNLLMLLLCFGNRLSTELERFGDRLELFGHSLELSCFAFKSCCLKDFISFSQGESRRGSSGWKFCGRYNQWDSFRWSTRKNRVSAFQFSRLIYFAQGESRRGTSGWKSCGRNNQWDSFRR